MKQTKYRRIGVPHRLTAFLMVWVMLFNVVPFQASGEADPNLDGIGIYNHVMTDQTDVQTVYNLTFYKTVEHPAQEEGQSPTFEYVEVKLSQEYPLYDKSQNLLYLESDGSLMLEKDQIVNFLQDNNSSFRSFLINNNITRVVTDVSCTETHNGKTVKVYEQYPTTSGFSGDSAPYDSAAETKGDPADNEDIPSREIYKINYETVNGQKSIVSKDNYKVKQFNLTPMVDQDVFVLWRDTKQPDNKSAMFDINRSVEDGNSVLYISGDGTDSTGTYGGVYAATSEKVERTITEVDSNNTLYTYSVPEYSADGKKYTYTAEEKNIDDYYIAKGTTSNHFTNYHLTDFTCTVNWEDAAHPEIHKYLESAEGQARIPEFIRSNFELLDETVDGHVYNALKVSSTKLNEAGFPEETKKFIESETTYDKITETCYQINESTLDSLTGISDDIKSLIKSKCDSVTEDENKKYNITKEIYDSLTDEIKTLITNNSTQLDETYYVVKNENIKYELNNTTNKWEIKIDGLQEITEDGTAKVFALKPKTTVESGEETVKQISVQTVTGVSSEIYTDSSSDSYLPLATNTGVRSDVVDRAYDGAELSLTLTGKMEFKGGLLWADSAKAPERSAAVENGTAGDFMLYRYVDTGNNATDSQMVSQVGTWEIDSGDTYCYKDSNGNTWLDKYDNTGSSYFYFAKERLSLSEYETQYIYPDGFTAPNMLPFTSASTDAVYNDANVFLNGATVKNSLTGAIGYVVDAKWIAAELQGGTGEIHYKLQQRKMNVDANGNPVKDENGNYTYSDWADIPPIQRIDPETGEPVTDENENDVYTNWDNLTIDGFSAELMEKYNMFDDVKKYDEYGNLIQYRVVQTSVSRTDNNKTGSYTTQIKTGYDNSGHLTLLDSNDQPTEMVEITIQEGTGSSAVSHKFEVRLKYDEDKHTLYYEYKLVGDVEIVMNKDWSPIPFNQLEKVYNAKVYLQLMKYNYTTGKYEKYDAEHGNAGGIKYTNGTRDETSRDLIEYTSSDATGIFTVERTNVVEGVSGIEPHYAIKLLNVPMYDNEGRLNRFSLQEHHSDPATSSSAVYSAKIDQSPMLFTASNIFGDGGEEIQFKKIWMDDGEEEYKNDVGIYMSARSMPLPIQTGSTGTVSGNDWITKTPKEINDIVAAGGNGTS